MSHPYLREYAEEASKVIGQYGIQHSAGQHNATVLNQLIPPSAPAALHFPAPSSQDLRRREMITQMTQKLGLELGSADLLLVQELWKEVASLRQQSDSDQDITRTFIQRLQSLRSSPSSTTGPSLSLPTPLPSSFSTPFGASAGQEDTTQEILQKRNRHNFDSGLTGKEIKRPRKNT